MRFFTASIFVLAFWLQAPAQVTLVRTAPTDSLNLSCGTCLMKVMKIALTRGQHAIPMNLQKPVSTNLLHWEYFDKIVQEKVVTEDEPTWVEDRRQLLYKVSDEELLSLHINLEFQDSIGKKYEIFLVLAGLNKQNIAGVPTLTYFDLDTYAPLRFSAIAQISDPETGRRETYDCIEGTCELETFDLKTGSVSGNFEFVGNRIGVLKRCFFSNGRFLK